MSDAKELVIVRGSTPLLVVTLPEDLKTSDIASGVITITQKKGAVSISKTLDEMQIDDNKGSYSVFLKQSETLKLDSTRPAAIQAKFCSIDDIVLVSFVKNIEILPVNNETMFLQDNPSGDTYTGTGESGIEIVPDLVDFTPDIDIDQITISTDDYNLLRNKPSLEGVQIIGDKTAGDFGIYTSQEVDNLLTAVSEKDDAQDESISNLELAVEEQDLRLDTIDGQIGEYTLDRNVDADEYSNTQIDNMVSAVSDDITALETKFNTQVGNHIVGRDVSDTEYTNAQIDTKVDAVSDDVTALETKVNTQLGNNTVSRDVLANEYTNAQIDTKITEAVDAVQDDVDDLETRIDSQIGNYTVARNVIADEYTNSQIDTKVGTVQTAVDTLSGKVSTQIAEYTLGRSVAANEYTNAEIDEMIAGAGDISALEERIDNQLGNYVVSRDVAANEYTNAQIDSVVDAVDTRIDNQLGSHTVARNVLAGEYTNSEIDTKVQAVQNDVDTLDGIAVKSVNTVTPVNGNVTIGKSDVGLSNVTNDAQVRRAEMGAVNGVATLNENGVIPSAQLPSFVDDVLEYPTYSAFPATGESGKIYIAVDTNLSYRWSGTGYAKIASDLALGETSSTAYAGDKGKATRDDLNDHLADDTRHITAAERTTWNSKADSSTAVTNVTYTDGVIKKTINGSTTNVVSISTLKTDLNLSKSDVGLGNVDNTSDANKPISTATQTALNGKVDVVTGKGLSTNDYTTAEKTKLAGIETGAQVNTLTGVKGNSEAEYRTGNVNITKSNIGLGNVDNTADADKPVSTATQTALSGKVDKVTGKGLSANDFTDTLKNKLDGIASGAEVNVQANWNTSDSTSDSYIQNKPSIPSKTSDLTNDSGFITSSDVPVKGVKGDAEATYRSGNVNITKANIGLGNVDNTSDASKPISTATQAALNTKITNPSGGIAGQVLTKTDSGTEWSNVSGSGDVASVNDVFPDALGNVSLEAGDIPVGNGSVEDAVSSIAPMESSPSTANHTVGEYITYNGKMYKVAVAIATGEALTIGTNIIETNAGSEIGILNTSVDTLNSNLNGLSQVNSEPITFAVQTSRADVARALKCGHVCSLHINNVSFSNSYTSGDIVLGNIPYKPYNWVRFMGYTISGNPVCLAVRYDGDVILSAGLSSLNAGTLIYASCCFVCQ